MKKNVVISGFTGQDGSLMADYLLENTDLEIYGIVRCLSVSNHENIEHLKNNSRVHIIEGDITDPHSMTSIISKLRPNYFINFAANSFVGDSWKMPYQVFETNTVSVLHQLEAIRTSSLNTRYYQAGSSEEFGDILYQPQDEKHPLRPRSPYGASKVSARQIVKVYRESYRLYAVVGWLFNHESHRRGRQFVTRKITQGVARIYHSIQEHKKLASQDRYDRVKMPLKFEPIELGNLEAKRDWSYSLDFMDGIWRMMNQERYDNSLSNGIAYEPDTWGFVVNNIKDYILASGETHSVRDFILAAFKAANIEIIDTNPEKTAPSSNGSQVNYTLTTGEPVVVVNSKNYRPAEVDILLGNANEARQRLGWKPKLSFNDLVSKMVSNDIALTQK